jgi:hypothetical protein
MPGDQVRPRLAGQLGEGVVGAVHGGQVGEDRERAVPFDLLVEVQRVRGEHRRARSRRPGTRRHRDDQLARGVTADLDQVHPRCQRVLPGEQGQPAAGAGLAKQGDLLRLRVRGELGAGGRRRGPEGVLGLGHHDGRLRELAEVADVIPVRVGDHDAGDVGQRDAKLGQRLRGRGPVGTAAPVADVGCEPGVDQGDGARVVADDPEEVVDAEHFVRLAVQVEVEVALRPAGEAAPVPDREYLPRPAGEAGAGAGGRSGHHWPSNALL